MTKEQILAMTPEEHVDAAIKFAETTTPEKQVTFGFRPATAEEIAATTEAEGIEEWREQFRSCFSDLPDEYECCNGNDCNCNGATVLESIETFIHHQLQKARRDWLREEINSLKTELEEQEKKGTFDTWQDGWKDGFVEAIQTIIDRYQAELDQPINSIFKE